MYKIKYEKKAKKFIKKLDFSIKNKVISKIKQLEIDPFLHQKKHIIETIGSSLLCELPIDKLRFLNSENKRISEKDYFPVLVTTYSIGDNKPLRPNYEKDFGYVIEDDKPTNWGGKVEIEITEIKFAN